MASNFKILVHQKSDNLHLTLVGDFDGTSACELLNVLKGKCNGADRIFIDTSGLEQSRLGSCPPPACHRHARRIACMPAYMAMAGRLPRIRALKMLTVPGVGRRGGTTRSEACAKPNDTTGNRIKI